MKNWQRTTPTKTANRAVFSIPFVWRVRGVRHPPSQRPPPHHAKSRESGLRKKSHYCFEQSL